MGFIEYFQEDKRFRVSLSKDGELFPVLFESYYKDSFDKDKKKKTELPKGQLNRLSENTCQEATQNLDNLIRKGGSFTRNEALFLEFCDRAFDKVLQ
jgi:hypothetical protein